MKVEPRLAAFSCAAVFIWSCNALWGVDDLSFDGVTSAGVAGGGSGVGGTTTSSTSSGAGGLTTSSGGTGGVGGQPAACWQACQDLFDCGIEDGNCPGFLAEQRPLFIDGCEPGAGCLATCEVAPAMTALINPDDCAATVDNIGAVNPGFADACQNGIAGCGGGGTAGFGSR